MVKRVNSSKSRFALVQESGDAFVVLGTVGVAIGLVYYVIHSNRRPTDAGK
jgi:hypothetical protein